MGARDSDIRVTSVRPLEPGAVSTRRNWFSASDLLIGRGFSAVTATAIDGESEPEPVVDVLGSCTRSDPNAIGRPVDSNRFGFCILMLTLAPRSLACVSATLEAAGEGPAGEQSADLAASLRRATVLLGGGERSSCWCCGEPSSLQTRAGAGAGGSSTETDSLAVCKRSAVASASGASAADGGGLDIETGNRTGASSGSAVAGCADEGEAAAEADVASASEAPGG